MTEPIELVIVEAPESYTPPRDGDLVLVKCDCSCGQKCPQGKTGIAACFVWMEVSNLKKRKYKTIYR